MYRRPGGLAVLVAPTALGFGNGLAQSDHFSAATAAAVQRWQKTAELCGA